MHVHRISATGALDQAAGMDAVAELGTAEYSLNIKERENSSQPPLRSRPGDWASDGVITAEGAIVRITTLGPFTVHVPTLRGLRAAVWRDERTRTLLKCLLAAPTYWMAREQIVELLWPQSSLARGQDALRHALSRLRHALEPNRAAYDHSPYIASDREAVWLVRDTEHERRLHLWVDRDRFEWLAHAALEYLKQAPDAQPMALGQEFAAQALHLYQDHFLPADLYVDWAQATRSRCRRMWMSLLWRLAHVALLERRFDDTQLLLGQLVEAMPDNEGAVAQLMRVQTLSGQRGEALRTYRTLVTYLASEYDSTPMDGIKRLADAIRTGSLSQEDLFTRSKTPYEVG